MRRVNCSSCRRTNSILSCRDDRLSLWCRGFWISLCNQSDASSPYYCATRLPARSQYPCPLFSVCRRLLGKHRISCQQRQLPVISLSWFYERKWRRGHLWIAWKSLLLNDLPFALLFIWKKSTTGWVSVKANLGSIGSRSMISLSQLQLHKHLYLSRSYFEG